MRTYGVSQKRVTWYDQGYADGKEGICDAPYQRGNKHYDSYMDGNRDGERFLEQERDRGEYRGSRNTEDLEA